MGDPITNEVLAERIDALRRDQRDDLDDIKRQIAALVSRELYNANRETDKANREADQARIKSLESQVKALESRGRWWWTFVLIPVAAILVNIWLSSKGVKP